MLNGKIYVINSPTLISAAMRNADISFEPFLLELSGGAIGLTKPHITMLQRDGNLDKFMHLVHTGFKGPSLGKLNVAALQKLGETLNGVRPGEDLVIPDIWTWTRDVLGQGITYSLFGENDPFTKEVYADLW